MALCVTFVLLWLKVGYFSSIYLAIVFLVFMNYIYVLSVFRY